MALFPTRIWHRIALGFSALNIAGAGYAAALEQGEHAGVHVLLAVAGGWWARSLARRRWGAAQTTGEAAAVTPGRLEALEIELDNQRRELMETQERLDFAERLLAQGAERKQVPS